jgi:hypothetical protein
MVLPFVVFPLAFLFKLIIFGNRTSFCFAGKSNQKGGAG